jgi:hypothetical protein
LQEVESVRWHWKVGDGKINVLKEVKNESPHWKVGKEKND